MRQASDTHRRAYRYTLPTMQEALRLHQAGLKNTQVGHEMGIPEGSVGRLIKVARQAQEPTDGSRELAGEPRAPVEDVQMPESFVHFFNWLSRRVIAAEDGLQETKQLLVEKTSEAERAWAEVTAHAKTDISREFSTVYGDYQSGRR